MNLKNERNWKHFGGLNSRFTKLHKKVGTERRDVLTQHCYIMRTMGWRYENDRLKPNVVAPGSRDIGIKPGSIIWPLGYYLDKDLGKRKRKLIMGTKWYAQIFMNKGFFWINRYVVLNRGARDTPRSFASSPGQQSRGVGLRCHMTPATHQW